jgi:hypothetical protein
MRRTVVKALGLVRDVRCVGPLVRFIFVNCTLAVGLALMS